MRAGDACHDAVASVPRRRVAGGASVARAAAAAAVALVALAQPVQGTRIAKYGTPATGARPDGIGGHGCIGSGAAYSLCDYFPRATSEQLSGDLDEDGLHLLGSDLLRHLDSDSSDAGPVQDEHFISADEDDSESGSDIGFYTTVILYNLPDRANNGRLIYWLGGYDVIAMNIASFKGGSKGCGRKAFLIFATQAAAKAFVGEGSRQCDACECRANWAPLEQQGLGYFLYFHGQAIRLTPIVRGADGAWMQVPSDPLAEDTGYTWGFQKVGNRGRDRADSISDKPGSPHLGATAVGFTHPRSPRSVNLLNEGFTAFGGSRTYPNTPVQNTTVSVMYLPESYSNARLTRWLAGADADFAHLYTRADLPPECRVSAIINFRSPWHAQEFLRSQRKKKPSHKPECDECMILKGHCSVSWAPPWKQGLQIQLARAAAWAQRAPVVNDGGRWVVLHVVDPLSDGAGFPDMDSD